VHLGQAPETNPGTLSAHLLAEAQKFFMYPQRKYRTKGNLSLQRFVDDRLRRLVNWRKTFAPQAVEMDVFGDEGLGPAMLDELYCRDLLGQVPDIVERTMKLRLLTLAGVSGESFVYLRAAANCYIQGLPEAAVALARAAIEFPLRKVAGKHFGDATVSSLELVDVVNRFGVKLLSSDSVNSAHRVRTAANKVLHPPKAGKAEANSAEREHISSDEALAVIEAARSVVLELGKRAG